MFFLLVAGLFAVVYFYLKYHYSYWQRLKIPGPEPEFLFGSMRDVITMKKNIGQQMDTLYNQYKGYDFIGFYKFLTPSLLIRSPELIKKILVQDFDHFNANAIEAGAHDEIATRNVFIVSGEKWRNTRNLMTPAFTSGKLKNMVPYTLKASNNMVEYISSNSSLNDGKGFDARDISLRYTTDNTASCGFGLEANSFDKKDCSFMEHTQKILDINFTTALRLMIIFSHPTLAKIFKLKFIESSATNYFRTIVQKTVKHRDDTSFERNDFLNQLIQMRNKLGESKFGQPDILAQCIQLIINGAEASSATMGFMFYLLATHSDVQERARKEIHAVLKKHNGQINYDSIKEMEYLDQVLNETLRLYPATLMYLKRCTKAYDIPKTDKTPALTVEPGTHILVGIRALHLDESFFPNPEKFDPERFSPENIDSIPKNVFLPFGDGPRICLGQRFAILQTKIGVARVLNDFEMKLNKNTIEPIVLSPRTFLSRSANPIYVNFYKRE